MKPRHYRWMLLLLVSGQVLLGLPAFSEPGTEVLRAADSKLVENVLRGSEQGSCFNHTASVIEEIVAIKKCMPLTENCASAAACDNLPPGSWCGQYTNGTDKYCRASGACCSCS